MPLHVDYFFSMNSPWTHFGAARLDAMVAGGAATVRPYPVDFATIFAASGGLPLPRRSPQRQAYRAMEMRRWREHLGIPVHVQPRHAPMDESLPTSCVIAARETVDDISATRLAHRVLRALWEDELDPADEATLQVLIADVGLDPEALPALARDPRWMEQRMADSAMALARGVFGAPSYVVGDEIFWGQDRLDFLQRRLAQG